MRSWCHQTDAWAGHRADHWYRIARPEIRHRRPYQNDGAAVTLPVSQKIAVNGGDTIGQADPMHVSMAILGPGRVLDCQGEGLHHASLKLVGSGIRELLVGVA